jgi:DNA polymerase-3 subunit delta
VDYANFLRSVERGPVPALALLHGADPQLLDDALAAVSRALFPDPTLAVLDREIVDARDAGADAIARSAQTLPLMNPRRLVAVRHCQVLASKGSETLTACFADPNPAACLLLLADEPLKGVRDRKDSWLLTAVPAAAVVELPARRGRALEEWLRQRAGTEGISVSDEAARLLVQWVGDDSAALLGEVRKAAVAGGADNRTVGVREVSAVVGEHRVDDAFALTRAVERGDVGVALRTLDRLLTTEEPMLLLTLLARGARTAWTVRSWSERGQSAEQIARILRLPPSAVATVASAVGKEPAAALPRRLARCWEVERRLKSGGEPRAELTILVAELCGTR